MGSFFTYQQQINKYIKIKWNEINMSITLSKIIPMYLLFIICIHNAVIPGMLIHESMDINNWNVN